MLPEFGFADSQWPCLELLWIGESDWRYRRENPSSGAYGIPQSLPAARWPRRTPTTAPTR